jgi:hypothetical protein
MTLHPKVPIDILLAPVAAEIDGNLQRLRGRTPVEIDTELQLELDKPLFENSRDERAGRVLRAAIRNVDLHPWNGAITEDGSGLRLTGGSVTIDLSLGAQVTRYIEDGP